LISLLAPVWWNIVSLDPTLMIVQVGCLSIGLARKPHIKGAADACHHAEPWVELNICDRALEQNEKKLKIAEKILRPGVLQ